MAISLFFHPWAFLCTKRWNKVDKIIGQILSIIISHVLYSHTLLLGWFQDEGIVHISLLSSRCLGFILYTYLRIAVLFLYCIVCWVLYVRFIDRGPYSDWYLSSEVSFFFFSPLPLCIQNRMDRKSGKSKFLSLSTVTGNTEWLRRAT